MGASRGWTEYLEVFHAASPGVTEQALVHARDDDLGTAYDWLTAGLRAAADDGDLARIIDVACGNAALQPRLAGPAHYLGVDLSAAELALARTLGRGPVVRADARALPVATASADAVVSAMGLMLVQPLPAAVDEIARVLRPGGTVALLLPALWPLRWDDVGVLASLTFRLRGAGSFPQTVSRRQITRELRRAGFERVETARHRVGFPVRDRQDARLAIRSLYTPGRSARRLADAEAALVRRAEQAAHATRSVELPFPLLRVVARRAGGEAQ